MISKLLANQILNEDQFKAWFKLVFSRVGQLLKKRQQRHLEFSKIVNSHSMAIEVAAISLSKNVGWSLEKSSKYIYT